MHIDEFNAALQGDTIAALRARIARLQAEVRAWRTWDGNHQPMPDPCCDMEGCARCNMYPALSDARAAVDQHKDLEPT